jgi:PAS domain-containing protein
MSQNLPSDLRGRAASRLPGVSVARGVGASASEALTVLHALASSPVTAPDALALLHELQVHQVELDLQAEDLRESRAELESALRRQIGLYDALPVGCFTVDAHLVVAELNRCGAAMLGIEQDDGVGAPLDGFLAPGSARSLMGLVRHILDGQPSAAAELQLVPRGAAARRVQAHLSASPQGPQCLVVFSEAPEDGVGRFGRG